MSRPVLPHRPVRRPGAGTHPHDPGRDDPGARTPVHRVAGRLLPDRLAAGPEPRRPDRVRGAAHDRRERRHPADLRHLPQRLGRERRLHGAESGSGDADRSAGPRLLPGRGLHPRPVRGAAEGVPRPGSGRQRQERHDPVGLQQQHLLDLESADGRLRRALRARTGRGRRAAATRWSTASSTSGRSRPATRTSCCTRTSGGTRGCWTASSPACRSASTGRKSARASSAPASPVPGTPAGRTSASGRGLPTPSPPRKRRPRASRS